MLIAVLFLQLAACWRIHSPSFGIIKKEDSPAYKNNAIGTQCHTRQDKQNVFISEDYE